VVEGMRKKGIYTQGMRHISGDIVKPNRMDSMPPLVGIPNDFFWNTPDDYIDFHLAIEEAMRKDQ
jgi:hypothetical protein